MPFSSMNSVSTMSKLLPTHQAITPQSPSLRMRRQLLFPMPKVNSALFVSFPLFPRVPVISPAGFMLSGAAHPEVNGVYANPLLSPAKVHAFCGDPLP
jgi:hypothetical protein